MSKMAPMRVGVTEPVRAFTINQNPILDARGKHQYTNDPLHAWRMRANIHAPIEPESTHPAKFVQGTS
jgi:hypothetical protein